MGSLPGGDFRRKVGRAAGTPNAIHDLGFVGDFPIDADRPIFRQQQLVERCDVAGHFCAQPSLIGAEHGLDGLCLRHRGGSCDQRGTHKGSHQALLQTFGCGCTISRQKTKAPAFRQMALAIRPTTRSSYAALPPTVALMLLPGSRGGSPTGSASTNSMPLSTAPQTVYCPSRNPASSKQMK